MVFELRYIPKILNLNLATVGMCMYEVFPVGAFMWNIILQPEMIEKYIVKKSWERVFSNVLLLSKKSFDHWLLQNEANKIDVPEIKSLIDDGSSECVQIVLKKINFKWLYKYEYEMLLYFSMFGLTYCRMEQAFVGINLKPTYRCKIQSKTVYFLIKLHAKHLTQ